MLPRILEKLRTQQFKFLGSGQTLLNNTYVGNLVDAVFLALAQDDKIGQVFNITDGALVTKRQFISTISNLAGYPTPTKSVPLGVAKVLAKLMESTWKLLDKQEAPLLNNARIKFLGLNLDFSIEKAKRELGYQPKVDFDTGMMAAIGWCRDAGLLTSRE